MKIISLNTWGGRAGKEGLLTFFRHHNNEVDIFCLQEIWSAPYEHLEGKVMGGKEAKHNEIMVYGLQEISSILTDYELYFRPHHLDNYGLLMFVRKGVMIEEEGEVYVHKEKDYIPEGDVGHHARNVQYIKIKREGTFLYVLNFHGLWNGKGKTDSEERLEQSKRIVSFVSGLTGDIVFCGDFNLLPDTKSLTTIEEAGFRNLIKEHGITSTRTDHYTGKEKFADYILASKGLPVKEFKVLPDQVSDHAPLFLEI